MRSRDQEQDGGHHGEQGEDDQAESVQDHGRELPITLSGRGVVIAPDLLCDHSKLFQYQSEFSDSARGQWGADLILKVRKLTW